MFDFDTLDLVITVVVGLVLCYFKFRREDASETRKKGF
jgi:hypothetical protein